jgi:hypothetical protein
VELSLVESLLLPPPVEPYLPRLPYLLPTPTTRGGGGYYYLFSAPNLEVALVLFAYDEAATRGSSASNGAEGS